jgi:hypothetical protein
LLREGRKGRISEGMGLVVAREGVVNLIGFILEFVFVYIIEVERSVGFHAHASTLRIV